MADERELERIWDGILSRNRKTIRDSFKALSEEDQATVIAHLKRMATEDGWQEAQRTSAQAALDVLLPKRRRHG